MAYIKLRKKRKKHNKHTPFGFTLILAALFGLLLFLKFVSGINETNFWRYYSLNKTAENNLVINNIPTGKGIISENGIIYIDIDKVREFIDPNIYYNADESRVIITTENEVLRIDGTSPELNFPVYSDSGKTYLPVSLLEKVYGVKAAALNDSAILSLDTVFDRCLITKSTRLYTRASKGRYFATVPKESEAYVYGTDGNFTQVKIITDGDTGGFVGYIRTELIKQLPADAAKPSVTPELWQPDGKINIAFDQIANAAGASLTMTNGVPEGVNVLCPTWFSFKDSSGEIINKANMDYVNWAHSNGVKVWGLITDNFDSEISHAVISNDTTREYVIEQLIAYARTYGLDGINIDFESVPKNDGSYWIQFLRELVPECHKNGLTVSCDLFVPKAWTAHYDRKAVGETVDYAIVMGYDEHYGGSTSAGSVASYNWSVTAITATIDAGVPKEKLILGIPFYTRIWTEAADGTLDSSTYSMEAAEEMLEQNNAVYSYDGSAGQNYAEYTDSEGRHRCWQEDGDSVKKRAELVKEYDIAGIAAWKLRMEKAGIFGIINKVIS